jgi:hypothetical protein
MGNSLSAQALADAKEIRRIAEANAKQALIETFQPTLQSMVTRKLREEDDYEDPDGFDIEIDVEPETNEEPPVDGGDGIGLGSFDAGDEGEEEMAPEGEDGADMEYENLLRELDDMEEEEPMDEPMMEGGEEDWSDPIAEGDDMGEEDIVERLLRELDGMEYEGEAEMFTELSDGGGAYDETATTSQKNHENRQLRRENARLKQELNEALKANITYKRTINEVNLLNAKLMYTTKALRTENLTESQQMSILETFDRAKSVREVKLVYTTIVESLKKRKPSAKRQVQEGLASKTTKAINPTKQQLAENSGKNRDVIRWKQLAGLVKDDQW